MTISPIGESHKPCLVICFQYFELTDRGQIRNDELCLEPDGKFRFVLLNKCKPMAKDLARQKWEYEVSIYWNSLEFFTCIHTNKYLCSE